jgi:ABC-type antimicrobial peptide transport system ATPase subunit
MATLVVDQVGPPQHHTHRRQRQQHGRLFGLGRRGDDGGHHRQGHVQQVVPEPDPRLLLVLDALVLGQQQLPRPDVLFADEPTGALDTTTGREVLELMRQVVDETAQTVVMVTHDPVAAAHADRVVFLADGRVAGFLDSPTPERVAERMTNLGR